MVYSLREGIFWNAMRREAMKYHRGEQHSCYDKNTWEVLKNRCSRKWFPKYERIFPRAKFKNQWFWNITAFLELWEFFTLCYLLIETCTRFTRLRPHNRHKTYYFICSFFKLPLPALLMRENDERQSVGNINVSKTFCC